MGHTEMGLGARPRLAMHSDGGDVRSGTILIQVVSILTAHECILLCLVGGTIAHFKATR